MYAMVVMTNIDVAKYRKKSWSSGSSVIFIMLKKITQSNPICQPQISKCSGVGEFGKWTVILEGGSLAKTGNCSSVGAVSKRSRN